MKISKKSEAKVKPQQASSNEKRHVPFEKCCYVCGTPGEYLFVISKASDITYTYHIDTELKICSTCHKQIFQAIENKRAQRFGIQPALILPRIEKKPHKLKEVKGSSSNG